MFYITGKIEKKKVTSNVCIPSFKKNVCIPFTYSKILKKILTIIITLI